MEKLNLMKKQIQSQIDIQPKVAIVLGSGLGNYAKQIDVHTIVSYHDIEGFPVSTVSGHKGQFIFGTIHNIPVVAMQGRVHYYEGYSMNEVVLPIRLMGLLGAKVLILTNAAGSLRLDMQPGDFMMIKDHIASFVPNPLRGPNLDELGPRFPGMSQIYDQDLQKRIKKAALKQGLEIKEGIYLQTSGPSYESCAEVRMYHMLGADAVGMSTACEAIVAKHMGMKVCGISCITNMASGLQENELSHEEVKMIGDRIEDSFGCLITNIIENVEDVL